MTNKKMPPNHSAQGGEVRRLVRNGGDSLISLAALNPAMQANQRITEFVIRVLAMAVQKARDMGLSGVALRGDFALRVSAIQKVLNELCPVHERDYHLRDCASQAPS